MLRLISIVLCAAAVASAAGCGGSDESAKAVNRVPPGSFDRLKLGTSDTQVVRDLGKPEAKIERPTFFCLIYPASEGPDTWLRACFGTDHKLAAVATVIGRKTAYNVDPPKKVKRAKNPSPLAQPPKDSDKGE